MYCVHCGSEMHDRANFCPKCGKCLKESDDIENMKGNDKQWKYQWVGLPNSLI